MGLSLSLLSSAWEEILNHNFLTLPYELDMGSQTDNSNKSESETISKEPEESLVDLSRKKSTVSKKREPLKIMLETSLSFKNLVQDFLTDSPGSNVYVSPRPNERESYEVIVENGKLVYRQSGMLLETVEGSKWIFVLSTSKNLYVGRKQKGLFQHSSFLSGGATTAAGRLVAHGGILEAIWPYSGHYLPTEENFRDFISFLEENHVDLTNVKKCSVDDDDVGFSFKVTQPETKPKPLLIPPRTRPQEILRTPANVERTITPTFVTDGPVSARFQEANRISSKWTSGNGPRIGIVRDYPTELQFRALEHVNLSPRISLGNFGPIPSPRPSPGVRLSPRISYIGLPSPRTPVAAS
ncbi:hypothetical protein L1987_70088 [Smallanthus sonchifolius]|uniref:Uncharacterized protein n=1 Tax=Smallanthus sonchifolius TaxID=185202 RepID=A0ACB9API1_9ASTR|nr:hypothetical protein L1987_70088 [Smallanthus sonchifolius]